ncbi:MAG: hypothetical protein ACRCS0_05825 [Albidovulum sp.]
MVAGDFQGDVLMIQFRRAVFGLAFVGSAFTAMATLAQNSSDEGGAVKVADLGLSENFMRMAGRSGPELLQQLLMTAFRLSPDGKVTRESVLIGQALFNAQQTVGLAAQYLALDLDLDGMIARSEIDTA